MDSKSRLLIFIDDATKPIAEVESPINFDLDTHKLVDGEHTLKIVSKDPDGKEGIRTMKFMVRNGPAIEVEGIKENAIVDGIVPVMVSAYGKGHQKSFYIEGSETPKSIPAWVWILIIGFGAWAMYYLYRYISIGI